MNISVDVSGEAEVHAMLAKWMDPELTKRANRATKKSANVLKRPLQAAALPLSKRMAASVYVHIAKRDKPAYVVGHHKKKAFFWHMVIGGTKAHALTARRMSVRKALGTSRATIVRGVKANPIVAQVVAQYGARAYQVLIADLSKDT